MIIAITGTSGSGKTTVIKCLKEWNYFKRRSLIVKNEDDFLTFKIIKFFLGDKLFSEYKQTKFFKKASGSVRISVFSFLVYWFYPLIVWVEFLWLHLVYSFLFRKHILLSDRYVYDYVVTFKEVLNIYNPLAKILLDNFPKPYLSFYLKIGEEIALERNKNNIKGKITADSKLHKKIVKEYGSQARKHDLIAISAESNVQDVHAEIKRYILSKIKLSCVSTISISGSDGTGKSTICTMLSSLAKEVGLSSKVVHFYHVPICTKLLKKFGRQRQKILAKESVNRSFLWALSTFIDSYLQFLYFRLRHITSLIIFDRYFYDYLVSFEYRNVPNSRFFGRFIPKTGKSFVFLSDPRKARARNAESLPIAYYETTNDLYEGLANDRKLKAINIDNKAPEEIADEIIRSI